MRHVSIGPLIVILMLISIASFTLHTVQKTPPLSPSSPPTSVSILYPNVEPLFLSRAFRSRFPWQLVPETRIAIVPHHLVAAREMASLFSSFPKSRTLILIGPDHFGQGKTAFTAPQNNLCTRLEGKTSCEAGLLDQPLLKDLQKHVPSLTRTDAPFQKEHSIYTVLPFLRETHPDTTIVPIIIRMDANQEELTSLTKALKEILTRDPSVRLITSIDMSHYQTQEVADFHDSLTREAIQRRNTSLIPSLEIDSPGSLFVALQLAKDLGLTSTIHRHTNSLVLAKALRERESTSHIIASFAPSQSTAITPALETEFWHQLPKIQTEEDRLYRGFTREVLFNDPTIPYFFGIVRTGSVISVSPFPFDKQRQLLTRQDRTQQIHRDLPRLKTWLTKKLHTNTYQLIY